MQRQRIEQAGARARLGGGVHAGKLHEAGALEVLAGQVAALAHAVDRRARGEERGQVVQRGGVGEGRRVHAALVDLRASRVAGGSEGFWVQIRCHLLALLRQPQGHGKLALTVSVSS